MAVIEFYVDGKLHRLSTKSSDKLPASRSRAGSAPTRSAQLASPGTTVTRALRQQADRLAPLFHGQPEADVLVSLAKSGDTAVIPTTTLIVEGANKAELKRVKDQFGLEIVNEGLEGKVLLRAPEGSDAGILQAAEAAKWAFERGHVAAAHPNFVRMMRQAQPAAAGGQPLWNHSNDGHPGVPGADVAAPAAWTLTRGKADIRIAVLDEGVDTNHNALQSTVVGAADFVDGNPHARPDGNDAHGTACAGIIVSQDANTPGLAPQCSLVAIRIAKGDGFDGWVFDDFQTADAIDWAWKEGKAHVLSNSWGGGPPVDSITRAFERARTRGRNGKGCVLAIATGNSNGPVSFPATLPNVLGVGASTPWDERKSPTSKDGETWWGSCFGTGLSLLAPGVKIATTDISGSAGYGSSDFITNFNGTSSATPHVAAAAGLILSVAPNLSEAEVRKVLLDSVDRLTTTGKWNKFVGWGRLNLFSALRLARRL